MFCRNDKALTDVRTDTRVRGFGKLSILTGMEGWRERKRVTKTFETRSDPGKPYVLIDRLKIRNGGRGTFFGDFWVL